MPIIAALPNRILTAIKARQLSSLALGDLLTGMANPDADAADTQDYFGFSCSISESFIAIGAPYETAAPGDGTGSGGIVYVFSAEDGSLLRTVTHPATVRPDGDEFGSSLQVTDKHLIVGAPGFGPFPESGQGVAYVFDPNSGALLYTFNRPGGGSFTRYGSNVAISATLAAVSDHTVNSSSGQVHIYSLADGSLVRTISNPNDFNTNSFDYFGGGLDQSGGTVIAISQDYVAIGATGEDSSGFTNSGRVYLFNLSNGSLRYTWGPAQMGSANDSKIGNAVAMTNAYTVIGALGLDSLSGKAFVFDNSTGSLVYTFTNPLAPSASRFGQAVGISERYVIVGASDGGNPGRVYIYDLSDGSLLKTITNPNVYPSNGFDFFGGSGVDISNSRAVAGAYTEFTQSGSNYFGHAYLFYVEDRARYFLAPRSFSVDEGSGLTIDVSTINVDDGTTLYWTVSRPFDFALSAGSFSISANTGSFTVTPSADAAAEGPETFTVSVRTGSEIGPVKATSAPIIINDTSL